jgi:hypothetical protein
MLHPLDGPTYREGAAMRRPALILALAAMLLGGVQVAHAPQAHASVALCNDNGSLGQLLKIITPTGSSIQRGIWAKVCVVYDFNSLRNHTAIHCRVWPSGTPCDIRAEVLHAKLDRYRSDGVYAGTLADNFFSANEPGYKADWAWAGDDITQTGLCGSTSAWQYQANDFSVRVRLGADGVLRDVGNVFSKKGWPCFPPAR